MKKTLKKYTSCNVNTFNETLDAVFVRAQLTYNGLFVSNGVYSTAPFTFNTTSNLDGYVIQYTADLTGTANGTYPLSFSANDGSGDEYFVIFEVVTACEIPTYTLDCCGAINLVWLNKEGGYENYIFTGRRQVYEVEGGEAIEFKTANLTRKNAQLSNIYNAVIVNTGDIPREHLVKLASLRSSIQAWIYEGELPAYIEFDERFEPILIDRDSIVVNDTREKIIQRSVRFIVAKEVVIQSQ